MSKHKLHGLDDKTIAAVFEDHTRHIRAQYIYIARQQRWNRVIVILLALLYAATAFGFLAPYDWWLAIGNLFARWW